MNTTVTLVNSRFKDDVKDDDKNDDKDALKKFW
jgi:hypothetical protein